jgi:hypothetical protein
MIYLFVMLYASIEDFESFVIIKSIYNTKDKNNPTIHLIIK